MAPTPKWELSTYLAPRGGCLKVLLAAGLVALGWASQALAGDPRDLVFECPCDAVWSMESTSGTGKLTLNFGTRSFRATDSGELALRIRSEHLPDKRLPPIGSLAAGTILVDQSVSVDYRRPAQETPITIALIEKVGEAPDPAGTMETLHEVVTLWPAPEANTDSMRFVDILTDTDGDGTSDVNERLAETSETDPESNPGRSRIDVAALYNDGFRDAFGGYPETRIHHLMTLANAMFVDSGTNISIRTVGMREVALTEYGNPALEDRTRLMDLYGADLVFQFHAGETWWCPAWAGGCAWLGGGLRRGGRASREAEGGLLASCRAAADATCVAHELGHNLGLAHSDRQGEANGAFRWSRGHYLNRTWGTIMSYGVNVLGGVFSDPRADCGLAPCGVPVDRSNAAHAVLSLDLTRFWVAALRAAKPDADGDGIVDAADALPHDPAEYADFDGDGIGDLADPDDDNDGVDDSDDPFPRDPGEWADADGDGVGDNADTDVADFAPFRDRALRAAVEETLGKPAGAPISADELAAVTILRAGYRGIRHLDGLELATNLQRLELWSNEVADLSPLSDLPLQSLDLRYNTISDVSPLRGMHTLRALVMTGNPVSDLSAVGELHGLEQFYIGRSGHVVSDMSPLTGLTALDTLHADGVGISDLAPLRVLVDLRELSIPNNPITDLSGLDAMTNLRFLDVSGSEVEDLSPLRVLVDLRELSVPDNPITDLSGLDAMTNLRFLNVSGSEVEDLSPLAGLTLTGLHVGNTGLTLAEVAALPFFGDLTSVGLRGLRIDDISALSKLANVSGLYLSDNEISDLAPLALLTGIRTLEFRDNDVSSIRALSGLSELVWLDLAGNRVVDLAALGGLTRLRYLALGDNDVSDIAPLVRRDIWDLTASPSANLHGNPLDRKSIREHIPTLNSWGVRTWAPESAAVAIPDPALRALIAYELARWSRLVDDTITEASMGDLRRLQAFKAGIVELDGIETARNLTHVLLGSNSVSDLGPLSDLRRLAVLDLGDNLISDLAPLLDNAGLGEGDAIALGRNPLSEEAVNVGVPALLDRHVGVGVDPVRLVAGVDRGPVEFDMSGYFRAVLGDVAEYSASKLDADIAAVEIDDGALRVRPMQIGTATVTVEARAADNSTATLAFLVTVRDAPRPIGTIAGTELDEEANSRRIELRGWFETDDHHPVTFAARSSDPELVRVTVDGGVLTVALVGKDREGTATVSVTATDAYGLSGTLTFEVTAGTPTRGFLRGWLRAVLAQQRARSDTTTGD